MTDDRIGLPSLLKAEACNVLGHWIEPAAMPRTQPGEALPGQIKRHEVMVIAQVVKQTAHRMSAAARTVQDQQRGAAARFLNVPAMRSGEDLARNIDTVAAGSAEVGDRLEELRKASHATGDVAGDVLSNAEALGCQADTLQAKAGQFIAEVQRSSRKIASGE